MQSGGTNSVGVLYLGFNSGSSGTYTLGGNGRLSAPWEVVGGFGAGNFTQSGGTNSITNSLLLGSGSGSSGTYTLSGNGQLTAGNEFVGESGAGSFTQSSGTNTSLSYFYLGYNSGSSGTYILSGSGLLFAPIEYVGSSGTGNFTQSGGTHDVSVSLALAQATGSVGTYNLNGGLLRLSSLTQGSGSAVFNFSGGTLQATSSFSTSVPIVLGATGSNGVFNTNLYALTLAGPLSGTGGLQKVGSGTLTLSASNGYTGTTLVSLGTLLLANTAALSSSTFDTSGAGSFSFGTLTSATFGGLQGSGNLTPSGSAAVALSVGGNNASTTFCGGLNGGGSLTKRGSGTFTVTGLNTYSGDTTISAGTLQILSGKVPAANEYVGRGGTASVIQSGGTNSVTSGPYYALYLGYNFGDRGTYSLSGGLLSVNMSEDVGLDGTGIFTQSGGTHLPNNFYIGVGSRSSGTYSLSGGSLYCAGAEHVGFSGTGSFTQTGGTHSSAGIAVGFNATAMGTYNLSGSGLWSTPWESFGEYGRGVFMQSGGTNTISTALYLGYTAGGSGTCSLSGSGLLSAPNEYIGIQGTGSFTQSGGTNSVLGSLVIASSVGSAGTYNLNGGVLSLCGLTQGTGSAAFNFSGGTFQTASSFLISVPIVLSTAGNNAFFNINSYTLTLAGLVSGAGGFQKVGAGTLTLSASNSYAGTTLVAGGTLLLAHAGALGGSTFDSSGAGRSASAP